VTLPQHYNSNLLLNTIPDISLKKEHTFFSRRLQNMVQVTKGKNVVIETYDSEFKEFTATAAQTDFTMANKAGETVLEYTRVYVDNVEVASADITVSSATPAVVAIAACTAGQIVQIYMPEARNIAYSVQQAIQMKVSTRP
jgi:acetamidase/formamidase